MATIHTCSCAAVRLSKPRRWNRIARRSLCVACGRVSAETVAALLTVPSMTVFQHFCETGARVEKARLARSRYLDYFMSPVRRRSAISVKAVVDPGDPQHAKLVASIRQLGTAISELLSLHLSHRSITESAKGLERCLLVTLHTVLTPDGASRCCMSVVQARRLPRFPRPTRDTRRILLNRKCRRRARFAP